MEFQSLALTRGGDLEKEQGFPIEWEPFPSILVGKLNRDRQFARIPIGYRYVEELRGQRFIMKGSFLRTREKGTLLVVEEQPDPQVRVGILLYAQPGFRGGSRIDIEKTLAKGQVWDSPIGNLGVGDACLAIVQPGDQIKVFRSGRLYGAHEEYTISVDPSLDFHVMAKEESDLEREATEVRGEVL
jgi:hypothetical protein